MSRYEFYEFDEIMGNPYVGESKGEAKVECLENCVDWDWTFNGEVRGPTSVRVLDPNRPARFKAFSSWENGGWVRIRELRGEWSVSDGWKVMSATSIFKLEDDIPENPS